MAQMLYFPKTVGTLGGKPKSRSPPPSGKMGHHPDSIPPGRGGTGGGDQIHSHSLLTPVGSADSICYLFANF